MSDFMGIVEMIDAQLLRRHNNTATEFFEAGQQAERDRIIKLLEDDKRLHNISLEEVIVSNGERRKFEEVCVPFCPGCEAIALIKGENKQEYPQALPLPPKTAENTQSNWTGF